MLSIVRFIDRLNDLVGRSIAWLTLVMVVVTFLVVVLRYLFNIGWIAMQESVVFMHAMVFMLGAGYTLKQSGHVRVDIFYQGRSKRWQNWVDLLGSLLLLMPFCSYIIYASWDYVAASWAIHEGSREAGGLPGVFLLKTTIPLMAALVWLQGLAILLRSMLSLRGYITPGQNTGDGGHG